MSNIMKLTLGIVFLLALGLHAQVPTASTALTAKPALTAKSGESGNTASPMTLGKFDGFQTKGRWREGTKLSQVQGRFQLAGERVQFINSETKEQLVVLENLCAQRVYKKIKESNDLMWQVQGVVTEFNDHNFLQLQSAIVVALPEAEVSKNKYLPNLVPNTSPR